MERKVNDEDFIFGSETCVMFHCPTISRSCDAPLIYECLGCVDLMFGHNKCVSEISLVLMAYFIFIFTCVFLLVIYRVRSC